MIKSPVLIIGCPRSGTTLLFNVLSEVPSIYSIGYESKSIIERYHHPSVKGWESGSLVADDLTTESRKYMLKAFERQAAPGTFWQRVNRVREWLRRNNYWRRIKKQGKVQGTGGAISGAIPQQSLNLIRTLVWLRNTIWLLRKSDSIRLLEKTPENCLRLPFLLDLFPDARVIYLIRDGRPNIHSLMEGWRQPHIFPGYQVPDKIAIPGDARGRWAFSLIPGWRELVSCSLEEVCAYQWIRCNEAVLTHREHTQGRVPYLTLRYEDVIANPEPVFHQIADFIGVDFEVSFKHISGGLPRINVVSEPDPNKWLSQNGEAIERILPLIQPMMEKLGYYGGDYV
jgi:hypothetical protein